MNNNRNTHRKTNGGFLFAAMILVLLPAALQAQDEQLTLEAAVNMALSNNERALSADQRVEAADARVTKARAFFLPSITTSGTYTRRPFEVKRQVGNTQIIVQNLNALSGVASFNLTIFDSHSLPTLLQSNSDKSAEEFSTTDAKRKLSFEVSNAFIATLSVDQVMEASKHRFNFAKQSLAAAKARYSAGLVSSNDVTLAELEYATAEMGVTQVAGQVETTYLQLGYLLNGPIRTKLKSPDFLLKTADEKSLNAEQLISNAQVRRPDVNTLRWRLKSQRALTIEPTLKWLPTLTLTSQLRYTNEAGLTGKNINWNAGLTMSWNLFDGLNRNGEYAERTALTRQAELDLQTALRRVELEVRDALVELTNGRAALKLATVTHDIALRNANETAELYRQGLISALQVADANVRLFEAEVNLVKARYGLGIAYLNFEAALGLDPFGKE